ncbi:MAG: hypothetical protein WC742_09370 [Gallionellaceae bacterium]|jgi:hypothetical protein
MQFLRSIFDVFSKRKVASPNVPQPISNSFRNRILLLCRDVIEPTGYISDFWDQVHQKLAYLHGTPVLSPKIRSSNNIEDVLHFLESCESDHFLDFVEYIFKVDAFRRINSKSEFVGQINSFFDVDNLPYFLTEYVEVEEQREYRGQPTTFRVVGVYPKVVLRENRLVHSEAIAPALHLLTDPAFSSANSEFLEALQDYRKKDYGDCLTKCGSAFESVMKVICDKKKWPYLQTDTASTLLNKIIAQTQLDKFFTDPLILVATLRNRLSTAHGAGTISKQVPQHIAQFAINTTASAILLLVEETRN